MTSKITIRICICILLSSKFYYPELSLSGKFYYTELFVSSYLANITVRASLEIGQLPQWAANQRVTDLKDEIDQLPEWATNKRITDLKEKIGQLPKLAVNHWFDRKD